MPTSNTYGSEPRFTGTHRATLQRDGRFSLPEAWQNSVDGEKLTVMYIHYNGHLLFVLEDDIAWKDIDLKAKELRRNAVKGAQPFFKQYCTPHLYSEEVVQSSEECKVSKSVFGFPYPGEPSHENPYKGAPFKVTLKGQRYYFTLEPDDERWVLQKPCPGNELAARLLAYYADPTNRSSGLEQNPTSPQPGGA